MVFLFKIEKKSKTLVVWISSVQSCASVAMDGCNLNVRVVLNGLLFEVSVPFCFVLMFF